MCKVNIIALNSVKSEGMKDEEFENTKLLKWKNFYMNGKCF